MTAMAHLSPRVVTGDLLEQPVEAIVNAWNRNVLPWWLLLPQGVSGAIKRRAGLAPFRELRRFGPMPLGTAVHTSAGKLPFKAIIHVAGIDLLWRSSAAAITDSVKNAVKLAEQLGLRSLAMPLIGAGSGSFDEATSEQLICQTLASLPGTLDVVVVRFRP
jgi:O-acetyl-ADP-ribose deacetylase (regulator of RNase III)